MTARIHEFPTSLKVVVALIFSALFFVGIQAPAAHAVSPVDVTVNVTTKAGTPLAGLKVYAYPVANHAVVGQGIVATPPGSATSKSYTFTTAGGNALDGDADYAFYFDAPGSATSAFDQFYGGTTFVEEATYWHYVTGQTTLDVTLATNSTFTGKVTGSQNKALAGVAVYAYRFDGNDWFLPGDPDCSCARSSTTNSAGVYTLRNLEPGTYRLEFVPDNATGYLSEYSGNTPVFANAAALTVGLGGTIAYNAALGVGGTLSGKVKIFFSGDEYLPNGITAVAFPVLPGGAIDTDHVFASRPTTDSGTWSIAGIPTGSYKVKLYDTASSSFVDVWGLNSPDVAHAITYHVTAGKTTVTSGINRLDYFSDLPDTSLELTVDDANGNPLGPDARVYIESTSGEDFFFQSDDSFGLVGGALHIYFMPAGTYKVWIDPRDGVSAPFIGTRTISAGPVGGPGNAWDIALVPIGDFEYSSIATANTSSSQVGTQYSINPGHTTLDDGSSPEQPVTYTYIWLRDDAPIFGSQSQTSDSYTSRGVDFGHKLSVIVRADAFGYSPVFSTVVLTNSVSVGAAPISTAHPRVLGPATPGLGSVLTADVGTWDVPGLTFTYQWYSAGSPVLGATGRTYTVRSADVDEFVTFAVAAHRTGYNDGGSGPDSAVLIGYLAAPKLTKASTFRITALADGIRLAATSGTWSPVPEAYTFDWRIGGVDFFDKGPVFDCLVTATPSCANAGLAIQVFVTASRVGYLNGEKTYLVRKGTAYPSTSPGPDGFAFDASDGGHPSFTVATDPAYLGHVLQASNPVYDYPGHDGGTIGTGYQWQRKTGTKWAVISKATHATYRVTAADVGHELRLRIVTTSSMYPSMDRYFPAGTGAKLPDLVLDPAMVTIYGSGDIGTVKSAATSAWPVSGVSQSYQWYVCDPTIVGVDCSTTSTTNGDWTAIAKATAANYVPPPALDNRYFFVRVTGAKSGYQSMAIDSASRQFTGSTSTAYLIHSPAKIIAGIVGGNAAVGRALTAQVGATDRTTGVTRSYSWRVCDDASGSHCTDQGTPPTALSAVPTNAWFTTYATPFVQFSEIVSLNGVQQFQGFSPLYPLVRGTNTPAPAPTITAAGSPATYTVHVGAWSADTTFTYAWYDGATPGDTDSDFAPGAGTTPVVVEITASRPGYADVFYRLSARKGTLSAQPTVITGTPSGGVRYGDTLTASGFNVPAWGGTVTSAFQWYLSSSTIKGKTTKTFVPSTAYIGKSLKVKVTLTSPFYNPVTYYTPSVVVANHLPAAGTPVIVSSPSGAMPGSKLTANVSSFGAGFSYTYLWERSSDGGTTWVPLSTTSSYTVVTTDVTKKVRVRVVAKRSGWTTTASIPSAPITIGYLPPLTTTSPFTVNGTGTVDAPLTISAAFTTTGVAATYSWSRNGVTIPGATGTTLTPTASWVGDELQAHVTASKAGHQTVTISSNEVRVAAANAPTGVGATYDAVTKTVSPGVWSAAGLTFTYRWYAVADTSRIDELHWGATWAAVPAGDYTVWVDAARAGYADGHQSIDVVVP